jgi:hypothetical protein
MPARWLMSALSAARIAGQSAASTRPQEQFEFRGEQVGQVRLAG